MFWLSKVEEQGHKNSVSKVRFPEDKPVGYLVSVNIIGRNKVVLLNSTINILGILRIMGRHLNTRKLESRVQGLKFKLSSEWNERQHNYMLRRWVMHS